MRSPLALSSRWPVPMHSGIGRSEVRRLPLLSVQDLVIRIAGVNVVDGVSLAVAEGRITAGHLGQTVVYVTLLVSSVAVLAEVWGDMLRAAGATERLLELYTAVPHIASPAAPLATASATTHTNPGPAIRKPAPTSTT